MAHGQPDYGAQAAKKTVYGMADNAELAARLDSIVTYDRRGDVVWLDDFESNINAWEQAAAGGAIALSAERCRSGGLSAKLETNAIALATAQITRHVPYPTISKIGFEISLAHASLDIGLYQGFIVSHDLGPNMRRGQWRYTTLTDIIEIEDEFLGWTQIAAGVLLRLDPNLFHCIKMVVDLATGRYVRLILDETEWDLDAYTMNVIVNAEDLNLEVGIIGNTTGAVVAYFYVDDAIITQNEP